MYMQFIVYFIQLFLFTFYLLLVLCYCWLDVRKGTGYFVNLAAFSLTLQQFPKFPWISSGKGKGKGKHRFV